METKTKNKISYLTFILSMTIIWHHAYNVEVYDLEKGLLFWLEKYLVIINDLSVYVFFVLSGFLFFQNYDESKLLSKYKTRFFSLVIPYFAWNFLYYVYFQIVNSIPFIKNNYGGSVETFSFSNLIHAIISGDYNNVCWFLKVTILFSFVFPLFYKLLKNKKISYLLLIVLFIFSYLEKTPYLYSLYLRHAFNYLTGAVCAIHCKDIVLKEFDVKKRIISAITILLSTLLFFIPVIKDSNLFSSIYYNMTPIFMWIVSDIFRIDKKPRDFMKITFIYFLCHQMVLEPIEKIFYLLIGNNIIGATLDYIFAPIITVFIIIIFTRIIKKIPLLYKVLSGNR